MFWKLTTVSNSGWDWVLILGKTERLTAMMYDASPYKAYNNTKLETTIPMPGLRSLTLSASPCRERRKPKTARSRRSVFVEVSQGRGGANELSSSLFLPFSPLPVILFSSSLCYSPVFSYQRSRLRFHLSFSSFSLERRRHSTRLALRSFRIMRSPFFSSHSVLLFFSASRSFLLLVTSSSCELWFSLRSCFFRL